MLLQEGDIVKEIYEVDRFLGQGAFAEVYRVNHKFLGRQALKVIKLPGLSSKEIEEMLGEAVILSRIGHPNVIRVFDAGILKTHNGLHGFFTMEYVAGGSLESFWRSHGANLVSVRDAVDIAKQVCRGLAVAHSENPPIVHRDIKPQNILVGYDASGLRVRVSDFGLAKSVNPLTLLASVKGTRAFKPPEMLSNMDSCAGDVWAIGSTLYLMLTDRLPYPGADDNGILDCSCWERPLIPPSRFNVGVDEMLDAILFKSLAIKQEERYRNAMEMLGDLIKWKPREVGKSIENKCSIDESKSALGPAVVLRETAIRSKLEEALSLSKQANQLTEAADLLEEVLNLSPELRDKYEYRLKIWRCGIAL